MLAWSLLFLYESQMIFSPLGNICWIHQLIVIYFSCAQVPLFRESHSLLMFGSFNCFVSRRSQFTCIFDRVIVYLNNKQRQLLELMTHLHNHGSCLFMQNYLLWNSVQFSMAQEYFKPVEGGVLVDVSCGSGLFSRKFAKSGSYSRVVALDFSENMLRQCFDFIKNDDTILSTWAIPSSFTSYVQLLGIWNFETCLCLSKLQCLFRQYKVIRFPIISHLKLCSNLALVRADVSRLPFPSGSVDAVHAGAALHCWPSPSNAVSLFFSCLLYIDYGQSPAILWPKLSHKKGPFSFFVLLNIKFKLYLIRWGYLIKKKMKKQKIFKREIITF